MSTHEEWLARRAVETAEHVSLTGTYELTEPLDITTGAATIKTFPRGDTTVLRVYEHALQKAPLIERFEYKTGFRVAAVFEAFEAPSSVAVPYQRDDVVRDHVVPGELTFTLAGTPHRVSAFEGHGGLWFVFADATTGVSTYRPGRFVEAERDGDGWVVDFNRAYLPPCAFSGWYNCPLPPTENVLSTAVEAGEKSVVSP